MNHEETQERLADLLGRGEPLPPDLAAHVEGCADCRALARDLRDLRVALLHVPEVAPPPALRGAVLRAARRSRRPARWGRALAGFGLAAALAFAVWWPARPGAAVAAALPDPAVVVALGPRLVVANNGAHDAPVSVLDPDGRVRRVPLASARPAWFTEGVRDGDRVYLADAGNDRVIVVDVAAGRVVEERRVPGGAAGLAVSPDGVLVKTAGGALERLGGPAARLAPEVEMPLADVMDAVTRQGGLLFVTHHARGEVYLLDAATLAVRRRVGGLDAPVALAALRDGVLVLDHGTSGGRAALVWLDPTGRTTRRVPLPGRPDKLAVTEGIAVVSDRAGGVTRVDLRTGERVTRTFGKPMDVEPMEDGHVVLADGDGTVRILDASLDVMKTYGR